MFTFSKVWQVAQQPSLLAEKFPDVTWIISCTAHCMHRVTTTLRKLSGVQEFSFVWAALCFSLLLNSKDLATAREAYWNLCVFFLSEHSNEEFETAKYKLETLLDNRPVTVEQMMRTFNKLGLDPAPGATNAESDDDLTDPPAADDDVSESIKGSIKGASPFTAYFKVSL